MAELEGWQHHKRPESLGNRTKNKQTICLPKCRYIKNICLYPKASHSKLNSPNTLPGFQKSKPTREKKKKRCFSFERPPMAGYLGESSCRRVISPQNVMLTSLLRRILTNLLRCFLGTDYLRLLSTQCCMANPAYNLFRLDWQ